MHFSRMPTSEIRFMRDWVLVQVAFPVRKTTVAKLEQAEMETFGAL
jgi:hypothetical protein